MGQNQNNVDVKTKNDTTHKTEAEHKALENSLAKSVGLIIQLESELKMYSYRLTTPEHFTRMTKMLVDAYNTKN